MLSGDEVYLLEEPSPAMPAGYGYLRYATAMTIKHYLFAVAIALAPSASADSGQNCRPIPDPKPLHDPPWVTISPSADAAASWCYFDDDDTKSGIVVRLSVKTHSFHSCSSVFKAPWPYGPLTVTDSIELLFSSLPEARFLPVDQSNKIKLLDQPVSGAAIMAGDDSGYAWICRSGQWYQFGWH